MHATCPRCGEPETIYPARVDDQLVCRKCAGWSE